MSTITSYRSFLPSAASSFPAANTPSALRLSASAARGIDKEASIRERIAQIKERIEQLRQMLAFFGGASAKAVLHQISQLASELGQLANALKSAAGDKAAAGASTPPQATAGAAAGYMDEGRAAYAELQRTAEAAEQLEAPGKITAPARSNAETEQTEIENLRDKLKFLKKQAERALARELANSPIRS